MCITPGNAIFVLNYTKLIGPGFDFGRATDLFHCLFFNLYASFCVCVCVCVCVRKVVL
jgi:hypothetical protein